MKKNLGFTLIELIVTIGIVSILATAGMVILNPAEQFKKANDAKKKADLSQIQKALENFYEDSGRYPDSTSDFKITGLSGATVDWGNSWQPYMNVLPKSSSGRYVYYSSGGQSYYLYARLEKGSDPQLCNGGSACVGLAGGFGGEPDLNTACQTICNYGVSSPNVSP